MVGTATIAGGAAHAPATLSPAERQAAQNALTKLRSSGGVLGPGLGNATQSATIFSGAHQAQALNLPGAGIPTLIHGQGSDTLIGGARGTLPQSFTTIGNDTVLGGSTALPHPTDAPGTMDAHRGQPFSLTSETINLAGTTAASLTQPQDTAQGAHTITLADQTKITITGLSTHDISKLPH